MMKSSAPVCGEISPLVPFIDQLTGVPRHALSAEPDVKDGPGALRDSGLAHELRLDAIALVARSPHRSVERRGEFPCESARAHGTQTDVTFSATSCRSAASPSYSGCPS